jgi:hypothetical protein
MANFKQHLTVSTSLGIAYGSAAHLMYNVPLPTAIMAGGLCSVSGMLPDIDSGSSKPLKESLAFAAAVVPLMLFSRLYQFKLSAELMVLSGAGMYLAVRFGLGRFLKFCTVHRGMFHSLPAAIIMGEIAFLLASGDDVRLRVYKAGGVVLGYISHLILDEIYSVEWKRSGVRLKKSFGSALKMYSPTSWWANISAYGKVCLLTYVVVCEPGWMKDYRTERAEHWERQKQEQVEPGAIERAVVEKVAQGRELIQR